jgi:hypothetical protein
MLTPEGSLALRLPSPDREGFLTQYKTTLCKQYGVVMKEYVLVPPSLLKKTSTLAKFLEVSYRYACSLKPKPTSRKKSTTKKAQTSGKPRQAQSGKRTSR